MLKPEFIASLKEIGGLDVEALVESLGVRPETSIRINRRKLDDPAVLGYDGLQPVSWCGSGFYLPDRPVFTLNPLFHAGLFYVQEASSMIHETIVGRVLPMLPPSPRVLDLCAAPGGKTTAAMNALPDTATVIANEIMPKRAKILRENLMKWGFPGTVVTSVDTGVFASVGPIFDLVIADAPCSGEGMMRKDETAAAQWTEGLVATCETLQRKILADAVEALAPGGILIYSTCTFNTRENEGNLRFAMENLGLEAVDLKLLPEWGISPQASGPYPALRFMPHVTRGEGLFAAVMRKPGAAPAGKIQAVSRLKASLRPLMDGIPRTETLRPKRDGKKEGIEIPRSEWALAYDFPRNRYPEAEVDEAAALSYLRHESMVLPAGTPRGFVVITYKGYPLGFVKNLGTRANNLYPAEWKIRNL